MKIKNIKRKLELFLTLIKKEKKIILCNTPVHENLGDHAIAMAEKNYIKKYFSDFLIVEIDEEICMGKIKNIFFKLISKDDIIILQGGGFMGDLWPRHEICMHNIIEKCPDIIKVIFPQTCYLSNNSDEAFNEYKDSYKNSKNVYFFAREKKSFELAKGKVFPESNCWMFPDIVLSLNYCNEIKRDGILACIREDKESILSTKQKEMIFNCIDKFNKKTFKTSTLFNRKIDTKEREILIEEKLKEFSSAELVITDRLHGMIFAAITGTPCLVLDNLSGKVSGVYNWIKELNYIKVVRAEDINTSLINEMLSLHVSNTPDAILEKEFKEMERVIREIYNNRR